MANPHLNPLSSQTNHPHHFTTNLTDLSDKKLFSPLQLGSNGPTLSHRIVHAPITRLRSPNHVPGELGVEYYSQRATPGGLIISEGVLISPGAGNYHNVSGIYNQEQISAWRRINSAVHAKGGFIYAQIWHGGRIGHTSLLGTKPLAPSSSTYWKGPAPNLVPGGAPMELEEPKEMDQADIDGVVADFATAAKNAVEAGFGGVEIQGANGYLIDQFLQDNINVRTDSYGGSIENRLRFPLSVVHAVVSAIGPSRVGIRLSPFSFFQGAADSSPIDHYRYVLSRLEPLGLSYIHIINAVHTDAIPGDAENWERLYQAARERGVKEEELEEYYSVRNLTKGVLKKTPLLASGGYDERSAVEPVERGEVDAVAYGRFFVSNPDLVERVRLGRKFAEYDRSTLYTYDKKGYTDYPTWEDEQAALPKAVEGALPN